MKISSVEARKVNLTQLAALTVTTDCSDSHKQRLGKKDQERSSPSQSLDNEDEVFSSTLYGLA